jgi:hypothetical protein
MTTEEFAALFGAKYVADFSAHPEGFLGAAHAAAFFQQRHADWRSKENGVDAGETCCPKIAVAFKPETFSKLVQLAKETKMAPEKMAEEIMEHFLKDFPTR